MAGPVHGLVYSPSAPLLPRQNDSPPERRNSSEGSSGSGSGSSPKPEQIAPPGLNISPGANSDSPLPQRDWKSVTVPTSQRLTRSESLMANGKYLLTDLTHWERAEVTALMSNRSLGKYVLTLVQKVENPTLASLFQEKMVTLGQKRESPAWDKEPEQETRRRAFSAIEQMKSRTGYDKVFTLNVFYLIRQTALESALRSGLESENNYFGQGIPLTTYPEYALHLNGQTDAILLICQICFRTLFPVAPGDKLMGQSIKEKYDGHFAQIVPQSARPDEVMFVAAKHLEAPKYDQIIIPNPAQVLIKYVVRFTSTESNFLRMNQSFTGEHLRAVIMVYLQRNPLTPASAPLDHKIKELEKGLHLPLTKTEIDLYQLLNNFLCETDLNRRAGLEQRILSLFKEEESLEGDTKIEDHFPPEFKSVQGKVEEHIRDGENLLSVKQGKKAHIQFRLALKLYPKSLRALIGAGNALLLLEDFDLAIASFSDALREAPSHRKVIYEYVNALARKAVNHGKNLEYEAALQCLAEGLRLDPHHPFALGICASIYYAKNNLDHALIYCERALAKDVTNAIALRVKGAILWERGEPQHALELLNASIESNPRNPFAYFRRAQIHFSMGLFTQAESDCQAILKDDRENVGADCLRAKILLKQGKLAAAEEIILKWSKKQPKDLTVLRSMGELNLYKKEWGLALHYFSLYETTYLTLLKSGKIEEREKLHYYQVLLSKFSAQQSLGGPCDVSLFQKAIEIDPGNPDAYSHRANYYHQIGQSERARGDVEKAQSLQKISPPPVDIDDKERRTQYAQAIPSSSPASKSVKSPPDNEGQRARFTRYVQNIGGFRSNSPGSINRSSADKEMEEKNLRAGTEYSKGIPMNNGAAKTAIPLPTPAAAKPASPVYDYALPLRKGSQPNV